MSNILSASATGCSGIISVNASSSHASSTSSAVVVCRSASVDLGDAFSVNLGYSGNTDRVFSGYVKQIEHKTPNGLYTVTAKDKMIRAVDYFVASSNPEEPFQRWNIAAEELVRQVLAMAGLTNYGYDATSFVFATGEEPAEVQLIGAYDYCHGVAELLSWHLYADQDGKCWFVNRKPFPMTGSSGQPVDTHSETGAGSASYTFSDSTILSLNYILSERDLRNRVVVYGAPGVYAEAFASSPYEPAGFYKTVVLSSPMISDQGFAQTACNYNLYLLNRPTHEMQMVTVGYPQAQARNIYRLNQSFLSGQNVNWYAYSVDHNFSSSGYTTSFVLRR